MKEATNGGKLQKVPQACVVHPFWPGSVLELASHFFNWAIGDSTLFPRFPDRCYWSFPNVPETIFFLLPLLVMGPGCFVLQLVPWFLIADFVVDACQFREYKHRCDLLHVGTDPVVRHSCWFYFFAHMLANLYVIVLECGRLYGHFSRGQLGYGLCRRFDWHCGRLEQAPPELSSSRSL